MVAEGVLNDTVVGNLIVEVGKVGNWIQALGLIVVIWIVVQVINLILNKKKRNTLRKISEDLVRIEKKVDRLGKKK